MTKAKVRIIIALHLLSTARPNAIRNRLNSKVHKIVESVSLGIFRNLFGLRT